MTEEEAQHWIRDRFGAEATAKIENFIQMVLMENSKQNLIAPSTIAAIWARHVVDSAQLTLFAGAGLWLDIGSGGGFPGMVAALIRTEPVGLVEPRCLRRTRHAASVDTTVAERAQRFD